MKSPQLLKLRQKNRGKFGRFLFSHDFLAAARATRVDNPFLVALLVTQ